MPRPDRSLERLLHHPEGLTTMPFSRRKILPEALLLLRFVTLGSLFFSVKALATPSEIRHCESASDCIVIDANCLPDMAIHKRYEKDAREEYGHLAATMNCMPSGEGRTVRAPSCVQGLCTFPGQKAPRLSTCKLMPTIDGAVSARLNPLIERLRTPIATTQRKALIELEGLGANAAAVTPLLDAIWQRSIERPVSKDQECYLGYGDFRLEILAALTAIARTKPVPSYIVAYFADRSKVASRSGLEEAFLKYFTAAGQYAAPAGPAVLDALAKSRSGDGHRRAMISVLKNLPALKVKAVPLLKQIASDPADMDAAEAMAALFSLDPAAKLDSNTAAVILSDSNSNQERTLQLVRALPAACPAALNCVKLLAPLTRGGSFVLMIEASEALGRYGKDALPAVEDLLRMYFSNDLSVTYEGKRYSNKATSRDALRKIDPSGDTTIRHVSKDLNRGFYVRETVELLEAFTGAEAKRLAAETRKRWRL